MMHFSVEPIVSSSTPVTTDSWDDRTAGAAGNQQLWVPEEQVLSGELQSMSSQTQRQLTIELGHIGYSVTEYHSHTLPNPNVDKEESKILEGMPQPAPPPRQPKAKFSENDDKLLIDLKENKSLSWRQIAEFFPGRSSGTLQVRYCTKLTRKSMQWTPETASTSKI